MYEYMMDICIHLFTVVCRQASIYVCKHVCVCDFQSIRTSTDSPRTHLHIHSSTLVPFKHGFTFSYPSSKHAFLTQPPPPLQPLLACCGQAPAAETHLSLIDCYHKPFLLVSSPLAKTRPESGSFKYFMYLYTLWENGKRRRIGRGGRAGGIEGKEKEEG